MRNEELAMVGGSGGSGGGNSIRNEELAIVGGSESSETRVFF